MRAILTRVIDSRPLAVGRILVGLVSLGFTFEWIRVLARVSSGNYLAIPAIAGWPAPSSQLVWILFAASLCSSAAMVFGIAGRMPAITVAFVTAAVLIVDQQTYSNHMVLLMMLSLFLGMSGSAHAWAISKGARLVEVPYWPAFLIKAQVTTLYAWTAIAKINPQYLSGEVLDAFLQQWVPIPNDLLPLAAILSVITEAFLAVALWIPRTRKLAFIIGAGLHIGIVVLMDSPAPLIGFGMLMLSGYVLFAWGESRPTPIRHRSQERTAITD